MARTSSSTHAANSGDLQKLAKLIKDICVAAEYWDGPSTTRCMLSLAKAVITKKRIEADSEHAETRLV